VELHLEGSAINGATLSSFLLQLFYFVFFQGKILLDNFSWDLEGVNLHLKCCGLGLRLEKRAVYSKHAEVRAFEMFAGPRVPLCTWFPFTISEVHMIFMGMCLQSLPNLQWSKLWKLQINWLDIAFFEARVTSEESQYSQNILNISWAFSEIWIYLGTKFFWTCLLHRRQSTKIMIHHP